jgi:hypothetical protein
LREVREAAVILEDGNVFWGVFVGLWARDENSGQGKVSAIVPG